MKKKIMDLIYLAGLNSILVKKIYDDSVKMPKNFSLFLLLSANNSFMDCVSIVYSLFYGYEKEWKREIKILPSLKQVIQKNIDDNSLSDKYLQDFLNLLFEEDFSLLLTFLNSYIASNKLDIQVGDLLQISKETITKRWGLKMYEDLIQDCGRADIKNIRNNISDHKNENLNDPSGPVSRRIEDKTLLNICELVKKIRIYSCCWFNYEFQLPNFPHKKVIIELDNIIKIIN